MMVLLSNFHFIRPFWLLLIPIVMIVWWLWRKHAEPLQGWRDQIDADLLQALTHGKENHRDWTASLILTSWIIAVVAIAGPTWKREPNPFAADEAPLMILLKADESMDQPDPPPAAIERAQLKISDLAKIRQGQPMGLIAYAGSAHLVLPPTRDTTIVAQMASEVDASIMPKPGDRLDLAILKAGEVLSRQEEGGSILVIANSVVGDQDNLIQAHQKTGSVSIQFLALRDDQSLQQAARALNASIKILTPDDADVDAIVQSARQQSVAGFAGKSPRWQEAGYWLVPVLSLLVVVSFRRKKLTCLEDST